MSSSSRILIIDDNTSLGQNLREVLEGTPELDVDVLELWMVNDRDQLVASGIDVESLVAETRRNHGAAQARAGRLIDWFLRVIAA